MGRSVLLRLLALTLSTATLAVVVTASLGDTADPYASSDSTAGGNQDVALLPRDGEILTALYAYADEHHSWEGVEPLLHDLAQQTGQRIALSSLDGTLIADSAQRDGVSTSNLPPLAGHIDATGPRPTPARAQPIDAASTRVVATHAYPLGWQLTGQEKAERRRMADSAAECLRRTGIEARFQIGATWQVFVSVPSGSGVSGANMSTHPCVPPDLLAPSAAVVELATNASALAAECLEQRALEFALVTSTRGLREVRPVGDTPASAAWTACTEMARSEAKRAFVAPPAVLHLGASQQLDTFASAVTWRTAGATAAVMLAAVLLAVVAARGLVRPLRALTAAAVRIADGDYSARVPVIGNGDVDRLATAFNAMAASVERSDQKRIATVVDIAHELRNPLANVRSHLEGAETGVLPLDMTLLRSVQTQCDLLTRLVTDLQDLAMAEAGALTLHLEERDASDIAAHAVAAHRARAEAAGVRLRLHAPDPVPVLADPARLHQAIGNLIANAITHNPAGTIVDVAVWPSGRTVLLAVTDNGSGIPPEHLARIVDRFYRVDPSSNSDHSRATTGLGLGLAITKHIVEAHAGRLEATSTPGIGSAFSIRLPRPANLEWWNDADHIDPAEKLRQPEM